MNPERINKLLDEKLTLINHLLIETKSQNDALNKSDFEKTLLHNESKQKLVDKMSENEKQLKQELSNGIPDDKMIKIKAEKINMLFEELIILERQNNILVNDALALMSGERINAYLKGKNLK